METSLLIFKSRYMGTNPRATNKNFTHLMNKISYISNKKETLLKDKTKIEEMIERNFIGYERKLQNAFGNLGEGFNDDFDLDFVMQHFLENTLNKYVPYYDMVISLTDDSFRMLGMEYTNKEDWHRFTNKCIKTIAKGYGINEKEYHYVASVHLKEAQPHIHILAFDASDNVKPNTIDFKVNNHIRKELIYDNFQLTIAEYLSNINNKVNSVKEITKDVMDLFDSLFYKLRAKYSINFNTNNLDTCNQIVVLKQELIEAISREKKAYENEYHEPFNYFNKLSPESLEKLNELANLFVISSNSLAEELAKLGELKYEEQKMMGGNTKNLDDFIQKYMYSVLCQQIFNELLRDELHMQYRIKNIPLNTILAVVSIIDVIESFKYQNYTSGQRQKVEEAEKEWKEWKAEMEDRGYGR